VIAPDINLLIYAVDEDSPFHTTTRAWLEDVLSGTETVGFAWIVLLGFLRLTTRPQVLPSPLSVKQALELVALWLAQPTAAIMAPGPRHFELLFDLLTNTGTGGNLTSDAHLAAIAIEHGAEVCSTDHDFGRFAGLHWRNPLTSKHNP
jgi:toxin-antitoxin system PIN domain toxin